MSQKVAAGFVIFRRVLNSFEYLLLQTSYGENHWTPPKGHLDEGEDAFTAALRETQEEAGLEENKHFKIVDKNYKIETNYLVKQKPKKVFYWLAEVNDPNVKITLSDEHIHFKWLKLREAIEHAKYEAMVKCLNEAEEYLLNANK